MQLSPLLLDRIADSEARGELKGHQASVLRILRKKLGDVSIDLEAEVRRLPLAQVEELGEALLDFTQASDLFEWLQNNSSI